MSRKKKTVVEEQENIFLDGEILTDGTGSDTFQTMTEEEAFAKFEEMNNEKPEESVNILPPALDAEMMEKKVLSPEEIRKQVEKAFLNRRK